MTPSEPGWYRAIVDQVDGWEVVRVRRRRGGKGELCWRGIGDSHHFSMDVVRTWGARVDFEEDSNG
jgi:hypothetical protein